MKFTLFSIIFVLTLLCLFETFQSSSYFKDQEESKYSHIRSSMNLRSQYYDQQNIKNQRESKHTDTFNPRNSNQESYRISTNKDEKDGQDLKPFSIGPILKLLLKWFLYLDVGLILLFSSIYLLITGKRETAKEID